MNSRLFLKKGRLMRLVSCLLAMYVSLFVPRAQAIEGLAGNFFEIRAGDKCLDAAAETLSNGGRIQLWDCGGGRNQKWTHDDYGRLVNGTGLCLDVDAPRMNFSGARVQLWECLPGRNQRWIGGPEGSLVNGGGLCLDVHAPDMGTNGALVQGWICNNQANQNWSWSTVSVRGVKGETVYESTIDRCSRDVEFLPGPYADSVWLPKQNGISVRFPVSRDIQRAFPWSIEKNVITWKCGSSREVTRCPQLTNEILAVHRDGSKFDVDCIGSQWYLP